MLKSGFLSSAGIGGVDSNMLFCDVTNPTKCIQHNYSGIPTTTTEAISWPAAGGTVALGPLSAHGLLVGEGTGAVVSLVPAADSFPLYQAPATDPVITAINDCHSATNALTYAVSTHSFGCNSISGGGGGSGGQVDYQVSYGPRIDEIGFSSTGAVTVADTETPTTLINTIVGNKTIAAGAMLPNAPGVKTLRFYATGTVGTTGTPTLTLTLLMGGVSLGSFSLTMPASPTAFQLEFYLTETGLTTASGGGCLTIYGGTMAGSCPSSASITGLNFATNQTIDLQVTWGALSASDTITVNELSVHPAHSI
jgi:hypothetical protein